MLRISGNWSPYLLADQMHFASICLFSLCLSNFLSGESKIPLMNFPFNVGERLEYEIKWSLFPVGSAVLEVLQEDTNESPNCFVLNLDVRTNRFADAFYKVRTSVKSIVDPLFARTLRYEKSQKEGKTQREISVQYKYDLGEAHYSQLGMKDVITPIPNAVFDPFAVAYFVRMQTVGNGKDIQAIVCDGKRVKEVVIRNGKTKKFKFPDRSIEAIETRPAMENLGGVFNKSPNGDLKVWFSNDSKRYPVKLISKVSVGSFSATLRNVYPSGKEHNKKG